MLRYLDETPMGVFQHAAMRVYTPGSEEIVLRLFEGEILGGWVNLVLPGQFQ